MPAYAALTAERAEVRRLTCRTIRTQAEDLAMMPLPLRSAVWFWLAALALEATDRAEHGCGVCGALIERADGACRAVAS